MFDIEEMIENSDCFYGDGVTYISHVSQLVCLTRFFYERYGEYHRKITCFIPIVCWDNLVSTCYFTGQSEFYKNDSIYKNNLILGKLNGVDFLLMDKEIYHESKKNSGLVISDISMNDGKINSLFFACNADGVKINKGDLFQFQDSIKDRETIRIKRSCVTTSYPLQIKSCNKIESSTKYDTIFIDLWNKLDPNDLNCKIEPGMMITGIPSHSRGVIFDEDGNSMIICAPSQ